MVDVLDTHANRSVLVHGFSVGGYMSAQVLRAAVARHGTDHSRRRFAAQVRRLTDKQTDGRKRENKKNEEEKQGKMEGKVIYSR